MSDQDWIIRDVESSQEWNDALELLASIYVGEGYTPPQAAEQLFSRAHLEGHGDFLVAVGSNGTIMGAVLLVGEQSELRQISQPGEREFRILGVSSLARGKGVGRGLVLECLRRAKLSGARRMVLSTQPSMPAAHRVYEHLGFVRDPERDWKTHSGGTRWVYSCELTDPEEPANMRTIVIMGAGGRDFHDFNVVFRDNSDTRVAAFTAAQIPGIENRVYPPSLAGPRYPQGIPIRPEAELAEIIREAGVDDVVLAYSDLSHEQVMHKASLVLAAGANFRLLGPRATMLRSSRPVIAVGAVRTGCGKSQTSRAIAKILLDSGLKVAFIRHPMPYGDLEAMRVQRFATLADIDAARPTVEEREEYEAPVRLGMIVFAGVDYAAILAAAEREADVIVWDGGNNDFPFYRPDLFVVVTDPLRPGHELAYHPGETCLRMADVVVINKIDSAAPEAVQRVAANVAALNLRATVVRAESPVTLDPGPDLAGKRVLAVEDGPTLTHGGMAFGAATVAARAAGAAVLVDPRPWAVGSIAETFARYPHIGPALPAMGYGETQLAELAATIERTPCDVVVTGTPIDISRLFSTSHPVRHARYELREIGEPTMRDVIAPILRRAVERGSALGNW